MNRQGFNAEVAIIRGNGSMSISSKTARFVAYGLLSAAVLAATGGSVEAVQVGFWNFDDNTANDSSGMGHHGTLAGTAAIVIDSIRGNVLSLTESDTDTDGDGKVDLGNPAGLNVVGEFSAAAWVNSAKLPQNPSGGSAGNAGILQRGHQSGAPLPSREFVLRLGIGGGSYQFGTWDGTNRHATFVAPPDDVGKWVHLAGTMTNDGTTFTYRLYRNGQEVNVLSGLPNGMFSDFSRGWAIGARGGVTGIERGFVGLLDDVRMYNHPLSPTEIASIMTPGDPPVLGDTNGNDIGGEFPDDFEPIRANFRNAVTSRTMGDLVPNGRVDFDDFREWKTAHLAAGGSLAGLDLSFASNVPEPSTAALALVISLGLLSYRRRK
jgi:Concanavalin A-like lectin/glucanases superfamily